MLMTERFVGRVQIPWLMVDRSHRHYATVLVLVTVSRRHIRTWHALVCVRSLLSPSALRIRAARAAATGEQPEETRSKGEGDTEPESNVHGTAELEFNTVALESTVEGT